MTQRSVSVLVVDDSPFDRTLAGRLLEKAGMLVTLAGDGGEALAMMESLVPDIILTDLMMPDVDGLQLVEQVRARRSGTPVVLMTAHGSEGTAVQALRSGAASYVPKRDLAAALVSTLESVLRLSRQSHHRNRLSACLEQRESQYRISNDLAVVAALIEQVEEELDGMVGFDTAQRLQVAVALREALINAIYHGNLQVPSELREGSGAAYEEEAEHRRLIDPYRSRGVTFVARHSRGRVYYVVEDEGEGFDRSTLVDPTSGPALERAHGRGLVLIHMFMDRVDYNERGNRLIMEKRCTPPTGSSG